MKKAKFLTVLAIPFVLAGAGLVLSGCKTDDSHSHNYSSMWSTDATNHWHACLGCDEIKDKAEHGSESTWTKDATYHWHICSVCEGEFDKSEHLDDDSNGICDICSQIKTAGSISPLPNFNKTYDGNAVSLTEVTANSGAEVVLTWWGTEDDGANYDVPLLTAPTNAGKYKVIAEANATPSHHVAKAEQTFEISKVQLTVLENATIVKSKVYDGTTTCEVLTHGNLMGVIGGDVVDVQATATYSRKERGTGITVTITYQLTGANAGNYVAPQNTTDTADIT